MPKAAHDRHESEAWRLRQTIDRRVARQSNCGIALAARSGGNAIRQYGCCDLEEWNENVSSLIASLKGATAEPLSEMFWRKGQ